MLYVILRRVEDTGVYEGWGGEREEGVIALALRVYKASGDISPRVFKSAALYAL